MSFAQTAKAVATNTLNRTMPYFDKALSKASHVANNTLNKLAEGANSTFNDVMQAKIVAQDLDNKVLRKAVSLAPAGSKEKDLAKAALLKNGEQGYNLLQLQRASQGIERDYINPVDIFTNKVNASYNNGSPIGHGDLIKEHFLGGPTSRNIKRIAGAGATYMAPNLLMRGISGGSFTRNSDGERDIAGIPFF